MLIVLLTANSSSYFSPLPADFHPCFTTPSLSSLQDLSATASSYSPPLPVSRPISPTSTTEETLNSISLSGSPTRPIPIPRRRPSAFDDLPVTPLTARFEKGLYFPHTHRPVTNDKKEGHARQRRQVRHSSLHNTRRMRSDNSTFCSPVASPTMPTSGRPDSPQQPRKGQTSPKSVPTFHLGTLPRFHPAVYHQSSTSSQTPPSPRMPKQTNYRSATGSRDTMRQYRELVEGTMIPRTPPGPLSPGPSAPRLDPLRSPGPVTPLVLEESSGYLGSGTGNTVEQSRDKPHSVPNPELVEMLIARESEKARQKSKLTKGR